MQYRSLGPNIIVAVCVILGVIVLVYRAPGVFFMSKETGDTAKQGDISAAPLGGELTAATVCPADFKLAIKRKSWSQSREDIGLFQKYFSNPLMCNGTFVELGALDGVLYSNTLYFETYMRWRGVLIEANPANARKLMKRRKPSYKYSMAVCEAGVEKLKFIGSSAVGGVVGEMSEKHKKGWIKKNDRVVEIPCKPLSWILKRSNMKQIDIFSLDVEGSEYFVLKTMDWSIPVKLFVIEYHPNDKDSKDELVRGLLREHGYKKSTWNIRSYCVKHGPCTANEVWENPNYPNLPTLD